MLELVHAWDHCTARISVLYALVLVIVGVMVIVATCTDALADKGVWACRCGPSVEWYVFCVWRTCATELKWDVVQNEQGGTCLIPRRVKPPRGAVRWKQGEAATHPTSQLICPLPLAPPPSLSPSPSSPLLASAIPSDRFCSPFQMPLTAPISLVTFPVGPCQTPPGSLRSLKRRQGGSQNRCEGGRTRWGKGGTLFIGRGADLKWGREAKKGEG
jgi:hypothetical protein